MKLSKIIDGVMFDESTFIRSLQINHFRPLYLITEYVNEQKSNKFMLQKLRHEMSKVADYPIPINPKTGMPDLKMLDLKMRLYERLDTRINGATIQRTEIHQKSLNYNMNKEVDGPLPIQTKPETLTDIDEEIARLEGELASRNSLPPTPNIDTMVMDEHVKDVGRILDPEFKHAEVIRNK